ncbi:MAG: helix-turn-helix domain-containing protein [Oscillospiraceae bacterium]|nr:helix-turn-helix domain-containing protein [Oscillospiraceae bacterium]
MNYNMEVIISEGESYKIEFKASPDKSLPAEVCAFANASGGRIFIGVDDGNNIVGTDVSNAARSRIQDTINKVEPYLNVKVDILENVIVLTVPEGTQKPYSCPAGFYLRSGSNTQKLDRDSIIEFLQNEGRVRYDEIVRENLPIDERFNEAAYKRYIKNAKISEVLDRDIILKNLCCAGMTGGKLCFTNAGALFFRVNNEDIMFRHAGVVCALYKGTDKANILDAKELNGDLVSNVDDAIVFLKKHLRISYKIESLRRENILELPEDALREAVVNAVCHRDYFEKGARVMVEIFDDRVDIVSPGGICKGITRENFGMVSITRNSTIASMFFRINYIEQMGTGIRRMRNATYNANVAEPEFEFTGFFKVTFRRREPDALIGRQSVVNRSQSVVATDRKKMVISFLENNSQGKVADFINIIGLSDGRVRALLREMVSDGTVEKVGQNRYTYYVLKR